LVQSYSKISPTKIHNLVPIKTRPLKKIKNKKATLRNCRSTKADGRPCPWPSSLVRPAQAPPPFWVALVGSTQVAIFLPKFADQFFFFCLIADPSNYHPYLA